MFHLSAGEKFLSWRPALIAWPRAGVAALPRAWTLAAFATLVVAQAATGQDGGIQNRTAGVTNGAVRITVAETPVQVDGHLNEAVWAAAEPIGLDWEVNPANNAEARTETVCRIGQDASHLYFACEARDPDAASIRAYLTDRDRTEGQDRIFLTLDPFADSRRGFDFGVTPYGVQHDRLRTEVVRQNDDTATPGLDDAWDAIWASAGRITEDGYIVEAAIPFRSFRFPELVEGGIWRFFITRERPRDSRTWYRSVPWDRSNPCVLCQTQELSGLGNAAPGMNLEVNPTLTADRREAADREAGGLASNGTRFEPGLDARWSPTPNLALNVTVNPDFSQIEADAAQLEANIRFPLLFPEKRPFFLEGADLFETPVRAVVTRSIADPVGGLKLSGKLGSTAFGAVVVRDEFTNLILPAHTESSQTSLEQDATSIILRARRDVGSSSNGGLLYAGRMSEGYSNHVAGADALFRPFRSATARVQFLRSETEYPAAAFASTGRAGRFGGTAIHTAFEYRTRSAGGGFLYEQYEPGFRADAGFMTQVDVRRFQVSARGDVWSDGKTWYTRIGANGGYWQETDWNGLPSVRGLWISATYDGPAQTFVYINPNFTRQRWLGTTHDLTSVWAGGSVRPSGAVEIAVDAAVGDAVDYVNGGETNMISLSSRIALRAGRHLDVRATHSLQHLSRHGITVLAASVSELRSVYSFSQRTFLRGILQYRETERLDLDGQPANGTARRADVNLLFSYKVNPLTVFFLGYGGDWEDTGLGGVGRPLALSGRALFMKLGYAWRP